MAKVAQIPDKPVGLGALSQSQSCRRRWKIARGVETIMLVCDILFLRSFKAGGQRSRSAAGIAAWAGWRDGGGGPCTTTRQAETHLAFVQDQVQ